MPPVAMAVAVGRVSQVPRPVIVVRVTAFVKAIAGRRVGPLLPPPLRAGQDIVARAGLATVAPAIARDTDIRVDARPFGVALA